MVSREFLQAHALFGGLSAAQVDLLLPSLAEARFAAGEIIIREGATGDELYFLTEGSVEVLKNLRSAGDAEAGRLAVLGIGDSFGEMAVIDIQERSATVRALTDVTALTLSNAAMLELYQRDSDTFIIIVMNVAREISRRLRRMDDLVGTTLFAGPAIK